MNSLGWDPYPGRFKVGDGRVVAVVAGLLLPTKHIVELQLPGAGAKHQESLAGGERTAGEATLILIGFPEHGDGTEPTPRKEDQTKDGQGPGRTLLQEGRKGTEL